MFRVRGKERRSTQQKPREKLLAESLAMKTALWFGDARFEPMVPCIRGKHSTARPHPQLDMLC